MTQRNIYIENMPVEKALYLFMQRLEDSGF